jgi:hypothetical protein
MVVMEHRIVMLLGRKTGCMGHMTVVQAGLACEYKCQADCLSRGVVTFGMLQSRRDNDSFSRGGVKVSIVRFGGKGSGEPLVDFDN